MDCYEYHLMGIFLAKVRSLPKFGQGPYYFDEVTCKNLFLKALSFREKTAFDPLSFWEKALRLLEVNSFVAFLFQYHLKCILVWTNMVITLSIV